MTGVHEQTEGGVTYGIFDMPKLVRKKGEKDTYD